MVARAETLKNLKSITVDVPIIYVYRQVLLPEDVKSFIIHIDQLKALDKAINHDKYVIVCVHKKQSEMTDINDLYSIGTMAKIGAVFNQGSDKVRIDLYGSMRAKINYIQRIDDMWTANVGIPAKIYDIGNELTLCRLSLTLSILHEYININRNNYDIDHATCKRLLKVNESTFNYVDEIPVALQFDYDNMLKVLLAETMDERLDTICNIMISSMLSKMKMNNDIHNPLFNICIDVKNTLHLLGCEDCIVENDENTIR